MDLDFISELYLTMTIFKSHEDCLLILKGKIVERN